MSAQSKTTCSVVGCSGRHQARGWCNTHYMRWLNHGDVDAEQPVRRPPQLEGQRFGWLSVIERVAPSESGQARWLCLCDCGQSTIVQGGNLSNGNTKSCGCQKHVTHGDTRHGTKHWLYRTWQDMKQRCLNPNRPNFKYYGGRGIGIYDEWVSSYETFRDYVNEHLGPRPDGYSLNRINNDGDYEPMNVEWASQSEQVRNSRRRAA